MTLFVKGDRYVYLAHPPKTGGTSVTQMLRSVGYRIGWYLDLVNRQHPAHWTADQYLPRLDRRKLDPYIHLLVRHPEDRLSSWWRYLHRIGDPVPSYPEWARGVVDAGTPRQVDYIPHGRAHGRTRLEDGGPVAAVKAIAPGEYPDEKHSAAGTQGLPTHLDPATAALVRDYFAADYETFGYKPKSY